MLLYEIDSLTSHFAHLHIQLWKYFNRLAFNFRDMRRIKSINFHEQRLKFIICTTFSTRIH
jgi:hypothetical protein